MEVLVVCNGISRRMFLRDRLKPVLGSQGWIAGDNVVSCGYDEFGPAKPTGELYELVLIEIDLGASARPIFEALKSAPSDARMIVVFYPTFAPDMEANLKQSGATHVLLGSQEATSVRIEQFLAGIIPVCASMNE